MSTITTCSINIINHSNSPKRFLLFQDSPIPTNGPTGDVFTNVYQRSPNIASGEKSHCEFDMDSQFYAIYGTSSSAAGGAVRISTSDSRPVKLGPSGSVVGISTKAGDPLWDDITTKGRTTAAKGGFSFTTDHSFTFPNEDNTYIGVGAIDPKHPDQVVPIQTYIAEPGLNSQLFPHLTYFISTGQFEPGTIVDRNTLGDCLKVDFTGCTIPKATFTVDANGNYTDEQDVNKKNGVKWEVSPVTGA